MLIRQSANDKIPVLFVRAEELPKGALVEFQVNVNTGRRDSSLPKQRLDVETEDSDDNYEEDLQAIYKSSDGQQWTTQSCESLSEGASSARVFATFKGELGSAPVFASSYRLQAL